MSEEKNILPSDELSDFVLYTAPSGDIKVEIYVQNETVWLTQQKIAALFGVAKSTISEHISNIYESNELERIATVRKFRIVQTKGSRDVTRNLDYYNLDAIISVGCRVNSTKATQFRIWATKTLRELLERVRSIRASERRIYQQITDIFAECSIDYDRNADITRNFYASVQNKFHYAITGKTAAEIIYLKADKYQRTYGFNHLEKCTRW